MQICAWNLLVACFSGCNRWSSTRSLVCYYQQQSGVTSYSKSQFKNVPITGPLPLIFTNLSTFLVTLFSNSHTAFSSKSVGKFSILSLQDNEVLEDPSYENSYIKQMIIAEAEFVDNLCDNYHFSQNKEISFIRSSLDVHRPSSVYIVPNAQVQIFPNLPPWHIGHPTQNFLTR